VHSFADDLQMINAKQMSYLACLSMPSKGAMEQGGKSKCSQGADKHMQLTNACCFAA